MLLFISQPPPSNRAVWDDRGYLKSLTHLQTRQACTTAWIASPAETVALLDEMAALEEQQARKEK
jgi:hypothetical protein